MHKAQLFLPLRKKKKDWQGALALPVINNVSWGLPRKGKWSSYRGKAQLHEKGVQVLTTGQWRGSRWQRLQAIFTLHLLV